MPERKNDVVGVRVYHWYKVVKSCKEFEFCCGSCILRDGDSQSIALKQFCDFLTVPYMNYVCLLYILLWFWSLWKYRSKKSAVEVLLLLLSFLFVLLLL